MEKKGYRENLEMLGGMFPGRMTLTPKEAAEVMGASLNTVYAAMKRDKDPLPSKKLAEKKIVIPIAPFARWLA